MIHHLRKSLTAEPLVTGTTAITIRAFGKVDDREHWVALRNAAFSDETPPGRAWTVEDFDRELATKWWWLPERTWFAELTGMASAECRAVGTVTLAARGTPDKFVPVVHWLAVLPEYRRQGVAQALLNELERAAYQAGYHELHVETHSAWTAAVRFYASAGYRP